MTERVIYANTFLPGINKGGVLKPDESGYYTLVLGALGVRNSAGEVYSDTPLARKTFDNSPALIRRISQGLLRGEYGHPDPADSPNHLAFESRVRKIKEDRVCCHFSEIWLEEIDYNGQKVTGILGKVKPAGPYGQALKDSLDNPKENVTFSGRYYSHVKVVGGVRHREIHTVGTWDYVSEPGIAVAQKYTSPTLESGDDVLLYADQLYSAAERERTAPQVDFSMESSLYSAEDLIKDLGLAKPARNHRYMQW